MATMKMSGCLALVARMPQSDQDALLARVDQYKADGIPAERAQVMAANDLLEEIRAERTQLMSAIAEQHPDLLTATPDQAAAVDPSAEDQALSFSRRRKPDPEKTVTAYKLFRVDDRYPGKLFPLFVRADEEVPQGVWLDADVGEMTTEDSKEPGKVKSKIGALAFRPGWHAGDLPIATHIGGERTMRFDPESGKQKRLPTVRRDTEVWAEIEMAADVDWQEEANRRASRYATNSKKTGAKKGDIRPDTAHITDQVPEDGFYRYKTNPNMTGNWLIGGSIKVNRILSDAEVEAINSAAGAADLPRKGPFDAERFGLKLSRSRQTETPEFQRWFGDSKVVDENGQPLVVYHGTTKDFSAFSTAYTRGQLGFHFGSIAQAEWRISQDEDVFDDDARVMPVYLSISNPLRLSDTGGWQGEAAKREVERALGRKISGSGDDASLRRAIVAAGYDGVVYNNGFEGDGDSYIAFRPEQIKSAIGNNGNFDPANPDITASRQRTFLLIHGGSDFDKVDSRFFGRGEPGNLRPLGQGFYSYLVRGRDDLAMAVRMARKYTAFAPTARRAIQAFKLTLEPGEVYFKGRVWDEDLLSDADRAMRDGYRAANELPAGPERLAAYAELEKKYPDTGERANRNSRALTTEVLFDGELIEAATGQPSRLEKLGRWSADMTDDEIVARLNESFPAEMSQPDITASRQRTPLGFYSALAEGVDGIKTNAAPAAGWRDAIKGLVNKGMVKADEIEWSGLNDWLDLQKGKVSREQVAEYLRAGGVQVEETVLGGEADLNARMKEMLKRNDYLGFDGASDARRSLEHDYQRVGESALDNYAFSSPEDRAIALRYLAAGRRAAAQQSTKYDQYALPGGENYREVLLTLPTQLGAIERYQVLNDEGELVTTLKDRAAAERMIEGKDGFSVRPVSVEDRRDAVVYNSSHWDQPNVLAHLRVNDRTDADGNRVLFVEEIQSDWGQEGKKKGFVGSPDGWMVVAEDGEGFFQTKKEAEENARQFGGRVVPFTDGGLSKKTPLAPFVTKTEGWLNLALKRAITMAVEGGYDKVAFTNGAQNAERFSLDKTLREIAYEPAGEGRYEISATDLQGREVISEDEVTLDRIEQLVGKEIAERIARDEGEKEDGGYRDWRYLRGDNLKVEAKGMRAFYDTIVPNAVRALAKKLGGRVETVEMERPAKGLSWPSAPKKTMQQPGLVITDEMRAKVSEGLPLFSRQRVVGDSGRTYTPEQKAMFERVGRTVTTPTLKERIAELRQDLGKKMAQGIADTFRPLRDVDAKAYTLARLSRGAAGAFEALLHHGKLSIADGAYDADMTGGFIERVGVPLHGELEDFLWWVAANRADRLATEDRENLFTAQDIAAGKSLDNGTTDFDYVLQHGPRAGQKTRDRTLIFRDALKSFDEFNKNTLDMAEQSGLIDASTRPLWEHEFYVPFYRVSDEDGSFIGAKMSNQLVRQRAFKRLKGGTEKLNSDLLANTLQNWGHLIDAAAKNRAAKASLEAAANMGIAVEADQATVTSMAKAAGKRGNMVWFMDQGRERYFLVEDPMVLTAITSLEYTGLRGPIMDALSSAKHWLTIGVTASPAFKIRNLVRDSIQAIATSDLSYNPVANIRDGLQASDRSSQTYVSALASGGLIRFGTMLEGKQSDHVRRLVRGGIKDSTILDSDSKVRAMYERYLAPGIEAYNEIGNRGEEINRAALFKQLKDQGVDQATAALLARDLMDFSMQGSWASIRFLTQVVPFMNARIQGLYKLGRSAAEDPRKLATVLGATALASIALMLAYEDDDDWKKREDWDRNNFWWFKIGGVAFRIPKPFEIGAMATLAERGLEYFINPEMTGKRLYQNVKDLVLDSLSMNPVPQLAKPLIDLYSNKDSFTKRPIETMGMERLAPQYRYTQRTSMVARAASTATFGALSPVQYDHLLRGYFGWLGSFAVGIADMVTRPLTNEPSRPTADYWKLATQGIAAEVDSGGSRYVTQMYEQAKELEQAMGTYRMLMKTGRVEEGREYFKENRDKIVKYGTIERVKSAETRFNEAIRMIERSNMDPDVKKERIRSIQQQKDRIARLVAPGYQR